MPRLDKTNPKVIDIFDLEFSQFANDLYHLPLDLCDRCYSITHNGIFPTIPHPTYDDQNYICAECGVILCALDDDPQPDSILQMLNQV